MGKAGHPSNNDIRAANSAARYVDPLFDTDPRRTEDRTQFLVALRKKNPEVLQSLQREVFPVYESIWKQIENCQTPEGRQAARKECERRWGPGVTFAKDHNDVSR